MADLTKPRTKRSASRFAVCILIAIALFAAGVYTQTDAQAVKRGSATAKAGFKNEAEIAEKFRNWTSDSDARDWLVTFGYDLEDIVSVSVAKPAGVKSDVRVTVNTLQRSTDHGISIKLVSRENGFNQIDKRWLRQYAAMWRMPPTVVDSLRLFTGEAPTNKPTKVAGRMYINELHQSSRDEILAFYSENRDRIVADLLCGDGPGKADWFLVVWRSGELPRWRLVPIAEAIKFYGSGPVTVTRTGNLKIGRITMQRKGGDGGRETAKMLQFKLDPTKIFEMK